MTEYIHFGSNEYDPGLVGSTSRFSPSGKPNKGIWASRTDAKFGWVDWCYQEEFDLCDLSKSFKFFLTANARIFTVDSIEKINQVTVLDSEFHCSDKLNREWLYANFDGIEFCYSDISCPVWETVFCLWDCDSICIWNPDVIVPLEETA